MVVVHNLIILDLIAMFFVVFINFELFQCINFEPLFILCGICRLVVCLCICALCKAWFDLWVLDAFYMFVVSCGQLSASLSNIEFVAITAHQFVYPVLLYPLNLCELLLRLKCVLWLHCLFGRVFCILIFWMFELFWVFYHCSMLIWHVLWLVSFVVLCYCSEWWCSVVFHL